MKPNELQIGDWATCKGKNGKVKELREHKLLLKTENSVMIVFYNSVEPILITPEILEKNGFKKELSEDNIHYRFVLIYDGVRFSLLYARSVFQWLGPLDFKFVHELQHALRLGGIDKEIKL